MKSEFLLEGKLQLENIQTREKVESISDRANVWISISQLALFESDM